MEHFIFTSASFIGSIAFALSGYMLGVRRELDIVGLFIVAMLTANGGGAIRDVLIGKTPVVLTDISAFYMVLSVIVIAYLLRLHRFSGLERRNIFIISDSIGLVAFSMAGALTGLDAQLSYFGVLVLAFITATGGGIIRDIFINEVPTLLSTGFYGSVTLIVATCLYILDQQDMITSITMMTLFFVCLAIRLIAHFNEWALPRIKRGGPYLSDDDSEENKRWHS